MVVLGGLLFLVSEVTLYAPWNDLPHSKNFSDSR